MPSLTCVVSPVRKATPHVGNCFLNPCRGIQKIYAREPGLGSLIWKLWPKQIVQRSKAKFSTLKLALCPFILGSAAGPPVSSVENEKLPLNNCSKFQQWNWEKEKAVCHMVRSSGSHWFANLLVQGLGKWNGLLHDRDVPLHQSQLKARIKGYHPWQAFS